jgi:hypothetical protein
MFRDQSDPFPPDPNAPRRGIAPARADTFPLDPAAPPRRPACSWIADALERDLAQMRLIGPAAGAELRRIVHGDGAPEAAKPQPRPARRRALAARAAALVTLVAGLLALASPAIADGRAGDSAGPAPVPIPTLSRSACGDALQCSPARVPLD